MDNKVVTRFAPSPTGHFHVGGVRSALYNFLFARQNNGKYILRSENTDKERSKKEFEDEFLELFEWLGLKHDLFFRQSERLDIYKKYLQKMIDSGFAYVSREEVKEEGQRDEVIRFKNPNKKITFSDLVLGEITVDTTDLGDFVIAKSLDEPVYHLAVVIDDFEMGVTHVIRGQEHAANTPRQILIQEAIGAPRPLYAHLPLILNKARAKLSKRDESVPKAAEYKEMGYLPEALLNFMALIGWNPGGEQEIFTLKELIEKFNLSKVQKGGGIFNQEKLDWINREHILRLAGEKQFAIFNSQFSKTKWGSSEKAKDEEFMQKLLKIFLDRIHRWGEVREVLEAGEYDYLFEKPALEEQKILWKGENRETARKHLERMLEILSSKDLPAQAGKIMQYAEEVGKGEVLWPLRYALSGKEKSPDPFTLIDILGVEESKERIANALQMLKS